MFPYAQLVKKLPAIGLVDSEPNIRNKLSWGKFTVVFHPMSRGYWRVILAAVGWLILVGAASAHNDSARAKTEQQERPAPAPASDYAAYPDKYDDTCYQARSHDAADLCAQWRAAIAAEKAAHTGWWGNLIGGVGGLLSFVSIALVVVALRQTEKSLAQAREANQIASVAHEREIRAYVNITKVMATPFVPGEAPLFVVEFVNSGVTPAKDLRLISQAFFFHRNDPTPVRFKRRSGIGSRIVLAPNHPMPHPNRLLAPIDEHQAAAINSGLWRTFYAGVIVYRDIFGKRHFTTFKAELDRDYSVLEDGFRPLGVCVDGNYTN